MNDKKDKGVAAIVKSVRDDTGVMRGRDVRLALTGKVDPEVVRVVAQLAEVNHGNVLHIASLAQMLDQMVDMLQGFTDIAENMKTRTEQMARAMSEEMEGAPTDAKDTEH